VDRTVGPGCADSHEDRLERQNTKKPAYMTEYICIYVKIYKFTCSKVDGNMYTTGLCTYIYIYTCILVYICLLELKMLCASRVPGGEVLKASNKFILVNYNFAPANNSL